MYTSLKKLYLLFKIAEIHLDIPPQHQTPRGNVEKMRPYAGMVQSLEIPLSEMIERHVRSIVYFAQG